jgi:hypothetical protein
MTVEAEVETVLRIDARMYLHVSQSLLPFSSNTLLSSCISIRIYSSSSFPVGQLCLKCDRL